MFVFDKPSGAGAFVPVLTYQSRVETAGGKITDIGRAINVYLDVTAVAEPSLLCACDAYELSSLASTGKLFNIIPE